MKHIIRECLLQKSVSCKLAGVAGLSALILSQPVYAGFEAEKNEAMSESRQYNITKGIDDNAPALKVFQDKYAPDTVREKYDLSDDWAASQDGAQPDLPMPDLMTSPDDMLVSQDPVQEPTLIAKMRAPHQEFVSSWRARKGENVRDILRRWSERETVDLMWASSVAPTLDKNFSHVGKFQEAVNELLRQTGVTDLHSQFRSEGLSPVMMEPASTVTTNYTPDASAMSGDNLEPAAGPLTPLFAPDGNGIKEVATGSETRWFALSGAPLVEVLRVWAKDEGASVIWQAEGSYALRESVSQAGSFEEAVFKALSQYDSEQVRPVGEIYHAPDGRKVLVIRTDVPS